MTVEFELLHSGFGGREGDALLSPPYTAFLIPGLAKSDVIKPNFVSK